MGELKWDVKFVPFTRWKRAFYMSPQKIIVESKYVKLDELTGWTGERVQDFV
jgi:hypothetical protein